DPPADAADHAADGPDDRLDGGAHGRPVVVAGDLDDGSAAGPDRLRHPDHPEPGPRPARRRHGRDRAGHDGRGARPGSASPALNPSPDRQVPPPGWRRYLPQLVALAVGLVAVLVI